jgi:hypothetical protein
MSKFKVTVTFDLDNEEFDRQYGVDRTDPAMAVVTDKEAAFGIMDQNIAESIGMTEGVSNVDWTIDEEPRLPIVLVAEYVDFVDRVVLVGTDEETAKAAAIKMAEDITGQTRQELEDAEIFEIHEPHRDGPWSIDTDFVKISALYLSKLGDWT